MNRRSFLRSAVDAAAAATVIPAFEFENEVHSSLTTQTANELIDLFVKQNDSLVDTIIAAQQNDKNKPFFGGFSGTFALFPVGKAAWYANRMVCSLVSPKSKHFNSDNVASAALRAILFVREMQHDDGTIDLTTTNFHSPPDTGFVVEPVALTLAVIRKHAREQYADIQETCESFLQAAGLAMAIGGIHTPNHRWVVNMALARINSLFPNEKLVSRIDQWLAEKIDIDSEGHYAERSTSIYSPLTNRCLITVSRLLDRPELLDPVRKNLRLTPYLVHANGEIATEVSRRQDQFRVAKMGNYFYPYRYMAIADNDGQYSAMVDLIQRTVGLANLYGDLAYLLEDDDLQNPLPPVEQLPVNFELTFARSKIVRIRREAVDATIVADNETFMTVHRGNAALRAIRFASAFFGKGQFKSNSIKKVDNGYVMEQSLTAAYYQPLAAQHLPNSGDWKAMPKHHRRQTETQKLKSVVHVTEQEETLTAVFEVTETERVPFAIELAFDREGKLAGVDPVEGIEDAFLLRKDEFTFTAGGDVIKIQASASSQHNWTQIRGALPKLDAQSVYITGFSPFKLKITIS